VALPAVRQAARSAAGMAAGGRGAAGVAVVAAGLAVVLAPGGPDPGMTDGARPRPAEGAARPEPARVTGGKPPPGRRGPGGPPGPRRGRRPVDAGLASLSREVELATRAVHDETAGGRVDAVEAQVRRAHDKAAEVAGRFRPAPGPAPSAAHGIDQQLQHLAQAAEALEREIARTR
jgi:hypothetical protein